MKYSSKQIRDEVKQNVELAKLIKT